MKNLLVALVILVAGCQVEEASPEPIMWVGGMQMPHTFQQEDVTEEGEDADLSLEEDTSYTEEDATELSEEDTVAEVDTQEEDTPAPDVVEDSNPTTDVTQEVSQDTAPQEVLPEEVAPPEDQTPPEEVVPEVIPPLPTMKVSVQASTWKPGTWNLSVLYPEPEDDLEGFDTCGNDLYGCWAQPNGTSMWRWQQKACFVSPQGAVMAKASYDCWYTPLSPSVFPDENNAVTFDIQAEYQAPGVYYLALGLKYPGDPNVVVTLTCGDKYASFTYPETAPTDPGVQIYVGLSVSYPDCTIQGMGWGFNSSYICPCSGD